MTEICRNTVFTKESRSFEKNIGNKVHFVYVLLKIRSKAFLLLLTLIPLFFTEELTSSGMLISILIQLLTLSAVLVPALAGRHQIRWSFDGRNIFLSSGIIAKRYVSISVSKIRSVTIIKTPFLSLFRAVRLDMRCSDGNKTSEISLYLSPDQANRLCTEIMRPSKAERTLIPRAAPFLLMAASQANFAAGLSAAAVFLFSLSGSSDRQLPEIVYDKLSETSKLILPYLPPVFAAAAALFLLGWIINFLKLCFSDARQTTTVSGNCIITVRGLISTRLTCIKRNSISSCFMKQTLLSTLFRQCSIGASFYGQDSSNTVYPLSAWHKGDYHNACIYLAGFEKKSDITVRPAPDAHHILWLPYASSAAFILLLWFRLLITPPVWFDLFSCIAAVAFVILLWKCCIGIAGAGKIKLELSGQHIAVTTVHLFSLYSQKIFIGKIARFEIRRTILQKARGLCTVYVRAAGAATKLKCRNLPIDMIDSLSERIK